ncbi:lysylphosphatidylglycerol synthase transmembrane domain-containing protein [Chondromyces crocatus]|uniref:Flippase-like domain-containing protein n=1 Tax=Chondromyces crocatus TaxID=52 RepID=A0A0K1E987_CHOCO|nr:lysylphosphatidylglycerol synthase transmembrane domain-containing protein [Chondromyces crocatus]AKT37128.1 uncharacterized protein CMC5_012580 [Chondromyces crocatus]
MAAADGATNSPERGWLYRHRIALTASVVVALGFAWLMHVGALPVVPPPDAFEGINPWLVVLQAVLYLLALYVRAHRWAWLLEPIHPVPLRRVLTVSFIGYGALLLLPFRTGEVVRPALIRREGKLSGWAAMGTVAAERIIDGLVLSVILLVALQLAEPLSPLPDHIGDLAVPVAVIPVAAYGALAVFAAAFAAIGLFYWRRAWARHLVDATLGRLSPRLATRIAEILERLADGLGFLPRASVTARFLAATVLYYLLIAASIQLLVASVGLHPTDFARATAIMGVLHLGVLLPNAPGYFGAFQVSVYAGLAMYHPPAEVAGPGAAVVFLLYATQIGLTLLTAAAALLIEHLSPRDALAIPDGAAPPPT